MTLGGTAVGTGIDAKPGYVAIIVEELSRLAELPFVVANNLIEACWDRESLVLFSGMLKRTARKLAKISNDLRLLLSGPRGGVAKIDLPALQPGSSILLRKVNLVVPEIALTVNAEHCREDLVSTAVATALTSLTGYERAFCVAKATLKSGQNIWEALQSELHLASDLPNQLRAPNPGT